MDYLGGAKFSQTALAEHPRSWAAGIFSSVPGFGDGLPLIESLAKAGAPILRVHLMWNDHVFTNKELPFIRAEARRLKPIIQRNPNNKWYVSPCCEHPLNESQWLVFANAVIEELSGLPFELVNSPVGKPKFLSKKYVNELHGTIKTPPSGVRIAFSFDGTNCVDSDVETYKKNYARAEYFMFWNCQMNGRRKADDETPRSRRKAYPTSRHLDSWIYLHHEKGNLSFPKGWTLKSHADQAHDTPQGKEQKPVFLTTPKEKFDRITLKAQNGQVIDVAVYHSEWRDEKTNKLLGHRYFCTDWGYLLSDKCWRIQGNPFCEIWVNGKKVGLCNPAFRSGTFR